ncbi:MAG: thiamine pyrophosphate-dependent dehydrogenase E1 component subunit alpha [Alphaproteobacteria bacterium]|nr:thiamine pyrophosphate-dependent dehydrogenase E1 component subunit alpha [Alphaproteobacteria bacterium]
MLRVRMVEEEIVERYGEQEMRCPTHITIGQEAPPVGVSAHLRQSDYVFSAHRSHGHYLAKNADLPAMIAELYGKATGCALGKGGSQHLVDLDAGFMGSAPILASTISVGVGVAWAAKRRGEDRVVVIYFGDGATEEGAFHEAINFAGVNRLPVVFVCENNLYSVHTPLEIRQPNRAIHHLATVHGMEGEGGDGNDVEDVWRIAGDAVERARADGGPSLIEFATYRWKEHCGPLEDVHLGYRDQAEFDSWVEKCPIVNYERRLTDEGVVDTAAVADMRTGIADEIEAAFSFAKESPFPEPDALARFVYPEPRAGAAE